MSRKRKAPTPLPSCFDLDMIMACRYAYYVQHHNIVSDEHYDMMEKDYELLYGPITTVGSDKKEDYTEAQRALAMYFLFTGRITKSTNIL